MAMENLGLISQDDAKQWQSEVQALNNETYQLLTDVGKALTDVQNGADSTIVDEIVKYGNNILTNSNQILEGMNGLVSIVTNLLTKVNEVLDFGKNTIGKFVGSISNI